MNPILKAIITTAAAKAIPAVEQLTIELLLRNGQFLQDKAAQAEEYGMKKYREMTQGIPFLNATEIDDNMVRRELRRAIQQAWERADDAVRQAAREVRQSLPAPASGTAPVTDPLTYTPAPEPGQPVTLGPSLRDQVPQD